MSLVRKWAFEYMPLDKEKEHNKEIAWKSATMPSMRLEED